MLFIYLHVYVCMYCTYVCIVRMYVCSMCMYVTVLCWFTYPTTMCVLFTTKMMTS